MWIVETTARECCTLDDLEPIKGCAVDAGLPRHKVCRYCRSDFILVENGPLAIANNYNIPVGYKKWDRSKDIIVDRSLYERLKHNPVGDWSGFGAVYYSWKGSPVSKLKFKYLMGITD